MSQPREVPKNPPDVIEDVKTTAKIASGIWSEQAALRTTDQKADKVTSTSGTDDLAQQLQRIASRLNSLPPEIQRDFLKNNAYTARDHAGKVDSDKQLAVNTNLDSLKKILTTA